MRFQEPKATKRDRSNNVMQAQNNRQPCKHNPGEISRKLNRQAPHRHPGHSPIGYLCLVKIPSYTTKERKPVNQRKTQVPSELPWSSRQPPDSLYWIFVCSYETVTTERSKPTAECQQAVPGFDGRSYLGKGFSDSFGTDRKHGPAWQHLEITSLSQQKRWTQSLINSN